MDYDENAVADLEKQVDDMLKQLDSVLKTHAAPGAPESEAEQEVNTADGASNQAGYRRRVKLHDNKATSVEKSADEEEEVIKSAEANDLRKQDDEDEDDTSASDSSKRAKKAAPPADPGETMVIDGQRIAKNEVGEPLYNILKANNDRLEKAHQEIQKAKDEAEMEKLKKRADDSYSFVPGSTEERAQMLKAMVGMSEELRKSFEKVFEQSQKLAKMAFETKGFAKADIEGLRSSGQAFESKVNEIRKRDACSRTEALEKARKEDPDGFKAFQGQH